jgi:hypothetical protein
MKSKKYLSAAITRNALNEMKDKSMRFSDYVNSQGAQKTPTMTKKFY